MASVAGTVAVLVFSPRSPGVLAGLEESLAASVGYLRRLSADGDGYAEALHLSFHARTAAVAAHTAMADALVAAGHEGPGVRRWYGQSFEDSALSERRLVGPAGVTGIVTRHASLRSVWFLNSARGALALAAAVAVADLTGAEHGFWVVLGTLSVLRTNAASTGATALRALVGTVLGFVIGALLLLAIGTGPTALWIALPVAVLVAAYSPGALPFTAGQAAFTVVISLLFNILAPAGWQIGVVRIEDVALGWSTWRRGWPGWPDRRRSWRGSGTGPGDADRPHRTWQWAGPSG
ncbi:FUSC family protein [Amycolatopsis alkalitolerans]|uniref:FUSC family protein n=1 Tax=Amycolatopsis alkalitolerans TaxID=2547244 RepID=UPI001F37AB43|nr:FUSC family protein [Amycolatopsis alkalitolerans]